MKPKKGKSLSQDFAALMQQVSRGKPAPIEEPTNLALIKISRWPKIFQHRSPSFSESKHHVKTLASAISSSATKTLDPLLVWWDGKGWTCIDGHHRIEAYQQAKTDVYQLVPVRVFVGTLSQAMGEAASGNTKDKLAMTSKEKSNAAWHMVVMTEMSKSEAAKAACVSEATIASMRKVNKELSLRESVNDRDYFSNEPMPIEFRDLSWIDAKRHYENRSPPQKAWDEINERKSQAMAVALRKAIGQEGGKYPEVFARALEIYNSRLPERLYEYWAENNEDGDETEEN